MSNTKSSQNDNPLKPMIDDPLVREAALALFKGDRERVEKLLLGADKARIPQSGLELWLLAHAVEDVEDEDTPEDSGKEDKKKAGKPDKNKAKREKLLRKQPDGRIDTIPSVKTESESAKYLVQVIEKRGAATYSTMANDILARRGRIEQMMKDPPGWQKWLIVRQRTIKVLSAVLGGAMAGLLFVLVIVFPPPDPAMVALATAAALEAQATGTQAAILALTPTVTPSVTPLMGPITSGLNRGISVTIRNCGVGEHLQVIQNNRPAATPVRGNYSYFFIEYNATCRDSSDNVCSINNDLDFVLQLDNNSSVPDVGLRVGGELSPDFLANNQTETGWVVFNIPSGRSAKSLLLVDAGARSGVGGTPTPTPVPLGIPLPCTMTAP